jgi:two-component system cell cycle sensor histidine kinase/response regulator CckA
MAHPRAAPPAPRRLLLVEDELTLARVLEMVLVDAGYDVTTCFDGTVALRKFDASPDDWDVVVSDVTMPTLSGDQLARLLADRRPRLPVILMTGNTLVVDTRRLLGLGVAAVLLKPFAMEDLLAAVNAACELARRQA